MDKEKGMCEWCNKIDQIENLINDSNDDEFPLWYHEDCYEKAKDKLGQ